MLTPATSSLRRVAKQVDPKIRANVVAWALYLQKKHFDGQSVRAMAVFVGVAHTSLQEVLNGSPRSLGLDMVVSLAAAFRLKVDDILYLPVPRDDGGSGPPGRGGARTERGR